MRVNLSESIMSSIKESDDKKYNYMLLSRLKSDCDYFLGHGLRNEKHLWAGSVDKQVAKMRELYNSFADDEKPDWLTMDQIDEYERKMKSDEDNGKEYHIENPTVIEDINKLHESFIYTNSEEGDSNLRLDVTDKLVGASHGEVIDFGKVVGFNKIEDTTYIIVKDGDKLYAYSIDTKFPFVFNYSKSDEFAD